MTVIIEQPQNDVGREETKFPSDPKELILDGGFVVPDANAFGQTFRDYEAESERQKSVEEFYRMNHIHQSVEFVKKMREEYGKLNRVEMSIWECCELLNEFVDESDPDLDEPQIEHLLQTAEAIRRDYPNEDWLHLTGLIHDLGKVLLHPSFGELPQWAVVGDTFPVGCAYDESNVHRKFFEGNPDYNNPEYSTKCGIYSEGCGLDNVLMSWGHDDYMYLVAKENKTTLPSAGLFIIRYHSFYPLHKFGAYQHLMNEEDKENLKWLHIFNKYDLYSKSKVRIDVEKVKPYYLSLIEKAVMSRASRGRSPAMSVDGAPPSYAVGYPSGSFPSHAIYGRRGEHYSNSNDPSPIPATPQFASDTSTEVAQVVREGDHRAIRQLITDAPFVKDASSTQPLRKSDFLFGDSVDDPEAVFIGAEHWLHKTGNGFIYLPEIPRHRSLTELRCQAVTREMSWRLTEEDAVRTLAANEESVRAELQEELRRSYDEKLSEFSQQILSHGLDV